MKPLVLFLCLLCSLPALAQPSSYDVHQDDRFNNYIVADAKLSGAVESQLSGIKWILGVIAVAVVGGLIGLGFAMVKRKLSLPIYLLIVAFCVLLAAIPVDRAECQGGCQIYRCRGNWDCPGACYCNQYYFVCQPR